ncbi:NAD-dependent epimerase/dehydratase family protein [Lipingzhangella halophila]|uniref:NAD-dependent epimerase/dehydratase family protein n=1 Tax=Lipingzhangella halophila TaxID=1783352 RepID=UPI00160BCB53
MPKTVLVTGGTGWIASQTIIELLGRGYDVRATVRDLSREKAVRSRTEPHVDAGDRLSFVAAELRNDAGWEEAMRGCGSVIHMAAPLGTQGADDLATMVDVAREGTLRVLKAAVTKSPTEPVPGGHWHTSAGGGCCAGPAGATCVTSPYHSSIVRTRANEVLLVRGPCVIPGRAACRAAGPGTRRLWSVSRFDRQGNVLARPQVFQPTFQRADDRGP